MNERRYDLIVARPAQRAISDRLPRAVAEAGVEFITGPLLENPRRIGKPLRAELTGMFSARLEQQWRMVYETDAEQRTVIVLDIQHRSTVYRPR